MCARPYHRPSKGTLDAIKQQSLLNEMGLELIESCSSDWVEITYEVEPLDRVTTSRKLVTREDQKTLKERHPHSVTDKAVELRKGMYQEGKGAWFSMRMHIIRPGRFRVAFNYDEEPAYMLPPDPEEFADDLQQFPRSPANIPKWLQEKLRQAK